jgi:hypothetical protein
MSFTVTATVDPKSLEEIRNALDQFEVAVQDRITKSALRQFAKLEMTGISQGNGQWLNPKHMAYRVKFWPKGIVWLGVGYRYRPGSFGSGEGGGRRRRAAYDAEGEGWRSHFAELGFHTWSTSLRRPPSAKQLGKGWKKGLYHRGRGYFKRGTKASEITHQAMSPRLIPFLQREIEFVMSQKIKGNKRARRKPVETYTG